MKFISIAALISSFSMIFATTLLVPLITALIYGEPIQVFCDVILVVFAIAGPIFFLGRRQTHDLTRIDGFILVVATWVTLCLIAAIPFYLSIPNQSIIDCIFEAVSGLTTTGAEVFNNIDLWDHSLKIYHQFLQFLGGLGIIVLSIAIMPLLGHNACALLDAEHTSNKEQRLTPRINKTAKLLWKLYISMVILSLLAYHLAGLAWFDAICYSFTTFSTGGFGIYADSLMHYNLSAVNIIACCFALLGSFNFAILYSSIKQKQIALILKFNETKCLFVCLLITSTILSIFMLKANQQFDLIGWLGSTIMMLTTTGLQIAEFQTWPSLASHLLLISALIGGASGSTTGGIKMHRVLLISQEIKNMFKHILHPRVITNSSNNKTNLIHGFLALNFIIYLIAIILMLDFGYDLETAFAGVTACLTNVGVTIHALSDGYHDLNSPAKILLCTLMLIGRLEATTIIVLLTPYFWREV